MALLIFIIILFIPAQAFAGPAAAIVATAAFSAVSAAGFVGFSLAAFAGSLILGGLSYALTPRPKKPNFDNLINKGQTVAVRQSDLTRQIVYGHTRITRGYAHMESTGLNGKLHQILILCDGPVRAIGEIILNDYVIPPDWIDSNGNVIEGRYKGKLVIRKHLGGINQQADPLAVSNLKDWTTDHRLQGIAYLYVIMTKDQDVYPTGAPNISAIVEGSEIYDPRDGSISWTSNISLYARDFLTKNSYGFGVEADDIDDENISAQANICDEIVSVTPFETRGISVSPSTSILTLDGDVLQYQFGDRVRISGSVPNGLSSDVDYYVIPYQVNTTPRILLASTFDDAMGKINVTFSGTSTNFSIIKNGEPRYHGAGIVDADSALRDTLGAIVNSAAGRAVCTAGAWTILVGAWREPQTNLGISDIRGQGIGVKNAMSMSESYNVVKGLFISGVNNYQASDYPSARYQQFIEDDNGVESIKPLDLTYTNRPTTAQRIAKIELFRGRQDIVYTSDFSLAAVKLAPGDNTYLDIERLGWEDKPFEVTESSFVVGDDGSIYTRLALRETAQQIFDWSQGEAIDYDPAPNTNLPSPFQVMPPTGVSYNSRYIETLGGDSVYMLALKWDEHPDAFVVQYGEFEIQYKLESDIIWRPSFKVAGNITTSDIVSSSLNTYYDIRIRAINNLGVRSQWTTIYGAVVGSSGGVSETRDYEYVNDPIGEYLDYGSVVDPINESLSEDWGYVV